MTKENLQADWQRQTTVVIPAFNEELAIGKCLTTLKELYPLLSIIVVDDGSTDSTFDEAIRHQSDRLNVIRHGVNRGYGAALKTAMKNVTTQFLVWFDADLQHDPKILYSLVEPLIAGRADAVLGARGRDSAFVLRRAPGKLVLRILSQIVARQKIPDLNCGYRAFKKNIILRYLHLLPDGFSASSTSTLLMLKRNYRTQFLPLVVYPRVGKSYVRFFRDGLLTLGLIFRIVLLFDAFLFFSIFAVLQFTSGILYSLYVSLNAGLGIPVFGALLIISGLLTMFLGIISSQISELRQERFEVISNNELD